MLGLPYPGGPLIDKYAKFGDSTKFKFSKPRIDGLDFSFSGLKTSILYTIRDQVKLNTVFVEENKYDLCASIQHTIIQILMDKIEKAVKETGIKQVAIAGGVSANSGLRKTLELRNEQGWQTFIPKFEYCTDNAAMIAITGKYLFEEKQFANQMVAAKARLEW
jgi:N6-L-threonylcarbamoyladenine synthase